MPRQKKYKEEEVIEKAMHTFWKKGYEGTSIRDLEKEMGINLFSIYASFTDKQGVMLKAMECYEKQLNASAVLNLKSSGDGVGAIKQYFYDFLDFVKDDDTLRGCFLTNSMVEMGTKDAKIGERVNRFAANLRALFKEKLSEAKEKGQLSPSADVEVYANYLMGSLQGLATSSKFFDPKALNDFIEISFQNIK